MDCVRRLAWNPYLPHRYPTRLPYLPTDTTAAAYGQGDVAMTNARLPDAKTVDF